MTRQLRVLAALGISFKYPHSSRRSDTLFWLSQGTEYMCYTNIHSVKNTDTHKKMFFKKYMDVRFPGLVVSLH